jgi:hypothetical protein
MPPNRPRIGRELVTGSGTTSVETPCNFPAFEHAAGLICKQEVAGSIPAGSTSPQRPWKSSLSETCGSSAVRPVVVLIHDSRSLNVREITCHDRYPAASSPAASPTTRSSSTSRYGASSVAWGQPPSVARRASGTCLRTGCCRRRGCAKTGLLSSRDAARERDRSRDPVGDRPRGRDRLRRIARPV